MIHITHETASAAILAHCDAGTLVQRKWHDRSDGREMACLLGAIHPSVTSPAECNGDLMPMWLAEMTPALFDGIAPDRMLPMARRYGELVGRWHVLSAAQWDSILAATLIRCIDDAVSAARPVSGGEKCWPAVEAACEQSRAAIAGAAVRAAAGDAARAAAWAAWAAAGDAARAAEAAAEAYLALFTFVLDQIEAECA